MAARYMLATVEPVDYSFGGWCHTCLLPSGVRVTAMCTLGPAASLRTFDRCTECLGSDVDPPRTTRCRSPLRRCAAP
jgi:hypothetical protein